MHQFWYYANTYYAKGYEFLSILTVGPKRFLQFEVVFANNPSARSFEQRNFGLCSFVTFSNKLFFKKQVLQQLRSEVNVQSEIIER